MAQKPSTGRGTADGGAVPDDAARSTAGLDADDLRASLTALSRLSTTGGLGLEDLLVQVATIAVQAIPRADGAGLTMIERGTVPGRRGHPTGKPPAHRGLTARTRCGTQVGQSRWSFW